MLTTLQDAVTNPDIAQPFTILRSPGQFARGGWQMGPQQVIKAYGTVGIASANQIKMIPEADRVDELRIFHSTILMYTTNAGAGLVSDILLHQGERYRVLQVSDQNQRGYYSAIASRMAGN